MPNYEVTQIDLLQIEIVLDADAFIELLQSPVVWEQIALMASSEVRANIDMGGRNETGQSGVFVPSQRVLGYPKQVAASRRRLQRAKDSVSRAEKAVNKRTTQRGKKNQRIRVQERKRKLRETEREVAKRINKLQQDIGGTTLLNTGQMIQGITSETEEGKILVGTNIDAGGRTPYPYWLQVGTSFMPERKWLMLPTPTLDKILATGFSDIDMNGAA